MKPEEMRANAQKKMKQVLDLMTLLHIKVEAKQQINKDGFIETVIVWSDVEKYPVETPVIPEDLKDPVQAAPETSSEEKVPNA